MAQGPGRAVLREALETLVLLLSPFTPHVCEEMAEARPAASGGRASSARPGRWPTRTPPARSVVELAVQVNGKVRGRITVPREAREAEVRRLALAEPRVAELVDGKQVQKLVVVPDRLVSLVVK